MFIILTNQRSGSHLLNTILDSHPELSCYGEIELHKNKRLEELGENEGAVYHYDQYLRLPQPKKNLIRNAKIINLVRNNLNNVARSGIILGKYKEKLGAKAHYHEDAVIRHPEFPKEEIDIAKNYVLEKRRKALNELWDCEMFTLSYEMLTKDETLSLLPKEQSAPLFRYLGVEPVDIKIDLKKPKYVRDSSL